MSASRASTTVLLGAGRGGTTLLYKLLSLHRDVAYLSNYQARCPGVPGLAVLQRPLRDHHDLKLATWFKDDGGAYFGRGRERLHALVPAPSEAESVYARCGIPLMPVAGDTPDDAACASLASRFEAIRRHAGGQVLLTKRTANNRRIRWLERAFGAPRYIDLVRDGRSVAASLIQVEWWRDTALFWAGSTPRQMIAEGHDELALAARNWVEELAVLEAGLREVPAQRVHHVCYESLLAKPREVLAEMLEFMGVSSNSDTQFWHCIDRIGLRPHSASWLKLWEPAQRRMVESIQREYLEQHGYLGP